MALCRLCLRNPLRQQSVGLLPSSSFISPAAATSSSLLHAQFPRLLTPRLKLPSRGFAVATSASPPASAPVSQTIEQGKENDDTSRHEVTVSADSDNSTRRKRGGGCRRPSLWRSPRELVPFGGGLFTPSGIGNALWQTTQSINSLLRNLSPLRFFRQMQEDDNSYKLQFEVPGLSKDDLKVTVEDHLLTITGEKKEEEEGGWDEQDYWSSRSYGYYNTSLVLPEDAKADEIKAQVKHGVLYLTIPRAGEKKRDVREVEIL